MSYTLHIPTSLEEAFDIRRRTQGTYLASGTVILANHRHAENLISLEKIPGLSGITDDGAYVRIGSMTTFDEIEKSPIVKRILSALWQAAFETAGPQIRHRATIGGNIGCLSPASDSVTALVALDAEIELFDGSCRRVSIEKLESLDDGAIITSVIVPKRFGFSAFEKVGKRNAMSVSVLNMALARDGGTYRVAVGCASSHVLYCEKASKLISGGGSVESAQEALLAEIHPINDRWGTVEYRLEVAKNLLRKLVKEAQL